MGALPCRVIDELKWKYKQMYEVIRFQIYPEDIPIKDFRLVPSYKRMCITILKNATSCQILWDLGKPKMNYKRKQRQ